MASKQNQGYKHIFGPVPSRRLGVSLGVDLVPHKTCTLNCVYCECGQTEHLTLQRKEYIPFERIKAELHRCLSQHPTLDFITFSGSGEPTLHSGMGEVIGFIRSAYPKYKVALLTNGTLLHQPHVSAQIFDLDLVKVSLDAASQNVFDRINRPHAGLKLTEILDSLISFRKKFAQQLWLEVFMVPGLNTSDVELKKIKHVINKIHPDRIQVNTLDRPGTESWVKPVDKKELTDIAAYLYNAEIIKEFDLEHHGQVYIDNLYERLLETIKRRPCTAEDISQLLGVQVNEVRRYLYNLLENGEIAKREMPRGVFYMKRS
jgi:wyosine [tRNA(Phe)-imidazoG37] synthetase (radical SAM superfamily)